MRPTGTVAPMPSHEPGAWRRFRDLVFSDLRRYRPHEQPSWSAVASRIPTLPGMLASVLIRAQQVLHDAGHVRIAGSIRTLSVVLVSMDIAPGMDIGPGLLLAHPVGVTIGHNLKIGPNVTFAGGVTCAARDPFATEAQPFATIEEGATIGAHAVLVGGVRIGKGAMVGANSVVLSDVPDHAVVLGSPARQVGTRDPDELGRQAAAR